MLPEIFSIGKYHVSGYMFFYFFGVLTGFFIVLFLSRREKLDSVEVVNYLLFLIISAAIGSRIYAIFFNYLSYPWYYKNHFKELFGSFFKGGIFYGGLLFGTLFSFFYLKRYFKGKEWRVLDITGIGIAIGHSIGRIGCFCAGCCYGVPTNLPWGVKFPYLGGKVHPYHNVAVHPTQLYESFLNFLNFIILFIVWKRRKFDGQIFLLYLINYGLIRFFLEFIRNDGGRGYLFKGGSHFTSLSFPQAISLLIIVFSFIMYLRKNKKKGGAHRKH